jgi:hypothetical protein
MRHPVAAPARPGCFPQKFGFSKFLQIFIWRKYEISMTYRRKNLENGVFQNSGSDAFERRLFTLLPPSQQDRSEKEQCPENVSSKPKEPPIA